MRRCPICQRQRSINQGLNSLIRAVSHVVALRSAVTRRSTLAVGFWLHILYVLVSIRASIFYLYSVVSMITVALPLSAGRTMMSSFDRRFLRASFSPLERLAFGGFVFRRILHSSVRTSSATVGCNSRIPNSTPFIISSIGIVFGVTAKLPPFSSTDIAFGDKVMLLQLTTILCVSN